MTEPSKSLLVNAKAIDEIASKAAVIFGKAESFSEELALAQAMDDIKSLLTPEVMRPIMGLMNSDLGFRTDKDPKVWNKKSNGYNEPYSVDVVRDVVIEARLRGFHTVGNEFNIIAGRFYGAQNGFRRKVLTHPEVTDFKDHFEIPRTMNGGAIIKTRAEWKRNGVPDSIEREFAVKGDDFSGADQYRGKAERKLYKAIHDRLTGRVTPEGEAGEAEGLLDNSTTVGRLSNAPEASPKVASPAAAAPSEPKAPAAPPAQTAKARAPKAPAGPIVTQAPPPPPPAARTAPAAPQVHTPPPPAAAVETPDPVEPPVYGNLRKFFADGGWPNFEDFRHYGESAGWEGDWSAMQDFTEIPLEMAESIWMARTAVLAAMNREFSAGK